MTATELEAIVKRQGAQIAAMTATPPIADANEIAKAWGRWDSLYQAHGDQAPRSYPGEKPRAYLRRLADGMRKYTVTFRNYAFHDSIQSIDLGLVTDKIFAEALAHAKRPPADGTLGPLREIVTIQHGKTRTEFIGDSRVAFAPFMHPVKFCVKSINRPDR
jgi:hypothetical protein